MITNLFQPQMDKKLSSKEELQLLQKLNTLQHQGVLSTKTAAAAQEFIQFYAKTLEDNKIPLDLVTDVLHLFIEMLLHPPYEFSPYHQKIRRPIDYYKFGNDLVRPLIASSKVMGLEEFDKIEKQIAAKENVVFFANHQTEADPQIISLSLEKSHPSLAEKIIYVAGERVVTDPIAIPLSLGCDLLCIYSKRYVDYPPEQKLEKLLHNKKTMETMSKLLKEGGKIIYVAPSGGRDRKNAEGTIIPTPFDPQAIEMFYLMAKKAKTPTHFYPLALNTYDLLPPPDKIQRELGESRIVKRTAVGIHLGKECNMEQNIGSSKEEFRKNRAESIWKSVCMLYISLIT